MKLIYHHPKEKYSRSPFDIAIADIVKGQFIRIACPYIGLDYFKNSIVTQCSDFILLTDVNELISSCRNYSSIDELMTFIKKYQNRIKHLSGLHSKVIISATCAFFGSANFTKSGITERNELSAVIDNVNDIALLNNWFDLWWEIASFLDIDNIQRNVENYKNDSTITKQKKVFFIESKHLIKTTYEIPKEENYQIENNQNEEFLINFLRHWGNREWLISYFDLARYIIRKYNIDSNDERLCISFRKEKYRIPITIGQRYILAPHYRRENSIGLIMPMDYDKGNAQREGSFLTTYFTKNKIDDAAWVHYDNGTDNFSFNKKTLKEWEYAIEQELNRSKISSFRKYNQSILYKFIVDEEFRKNILDELP